MYTVNVKDGRYFMIMFTQVKQKYNLQFFRKNILLIGFHIVPSFTQQYSPKSYIKYKQFLIIIFILDIKISSIENMKEQGSSSNQKIVTFSNYDTRQDQKELDQLKKQVTTKHQFNCKSEIYITHPDFKMLCCYLFFALASEDKYNQKKVKPILQRMYDAQSQQNKDQYIKICKQKFPLWWDRAKSLAETIQNKQNVLITNKIALCKVSQNISQADGQQLLRSGLADVPIAVELHKNNQIKSIINKNNAQDLIIIYKGKNLDYYTIAIYSKKQSEIRASLLHDKRQSKQSRVSRESINSNQQQQAKQIQIQIQRRKDKQEQIQPKKQSSQIKKAQSSPHIDIEQPSKTDKKSQKDKKKIPRTFSQNDKDQVQARPQNFEQNQITWFETTVIVIIFLAVLSELAHIFDPFLKNYNENVGRYYLLDLGYRLSRILFGKGADNL